MKGLFPAALAAMLAMAPLAHAAELAADVVVKRGTSELTFAEIDARVNEVPATDRAGFMDSPQRIETMLRQQLLLEQLADEAEQKGLADTAEFRARLDLARKRVLAGMRNDQLLRDAPKADGAALAREAYLANPQRFAQPETIDVRHILIMTNDTMEADARARIDALREEIAAGKITFAAAAEQNSDDKVSAVRGGLLTNIRRGMTDKAFDAAAFALTKPGDMVVVQSQFGIHLIQLEARHVARPLSQEEAVAEYADNFALEAAARYQKEYVERLQNEPLEADPDRVASLRTRYAKPADTTAADKGKD